MQCKKTYILVNFLLLIAAALCLQGCSHTSTSIDRALVIGISTNQDKDNAALPNAAAEAENFGKTLSSHTNIPSRHLRVITANDEQMTRGNLLNELHQFAGQTSKNDAAWLMIDGHGVEINGENYFYTSESKQAKGTPAKKTLIGMQDIMQALNGMQAKELIITLAQNVLAPPSEYPANFSSPSLSESTWNAKWKIPSGVHSVVTFNFLGWERHLTDKPLENVFTYYLVKGLGGGAADRDGKVKLRNLLRYVQLGSISRIQLYGGDIGSCAWSVAGKNKSATLDIVLAKNLQPSLGGESAVSSPPYTNADNASEAAMLRGLELQITIEQHLKDNGELAEAIKQHKLLHLTRTSLAPVKSQFIKAVRLSPNSPLANYELGILELKMCNFDNAQKYFEKAIKLVPKSAIPLVGMAILMQHEGKYHEAGILEQKAIKLAPNDILIKYNLAIAYERTHEFEKAKKLLQHIIKENPTWSAPLDALSDIYYVGGDKEQAIQLMQQSYKLDPNDKDVVHKLAWVYHYQFKDYQKSEQLYRKLIKLSPESGLYRREFADCLLQEGNINEAKTQAKKAMDLGYPTNDPLFKKLKVN